MTSCPYCNKSLPVIATVCPYCGKSLDSAEATTTDDLDVDERLKKLEEEMEARLGKRKETPDMTRSISKSAQPSAGSKYGVSASSMMEEITPGILMPNAVEVENYRKIVFESNHVKSNPQYANITQQTLFNYYPDDQRFNAYAAQTNLGSRIVLLGGLVAMFSQMAFMMVSQTFSDGNQLSRIRGKRKILQKKANEPAQIPQDMLDSFIMTGRELLGAMVIYVIAHELGHVVYGHIFGPGYDRQPIDVSRNQERDADSFASSVIASSRYAPFLVQGQILALYSFAMIEQDSGESAEPGTHPIAKERLKNAIRANSEAAEAMGLSEGMIDEMFSNTE